MKKALCTIGWGILAFAIAQGVFAFVSGMIFSTMAAGDVHTGNFPQLFARTGSVFAIIISLTFVLSGIRGRLPGTRG